MHRVNLTRIKAVDSVCRVTSVPQLDEQHGRVAVRQPTLQRSDRRTDHLPAVRHHQTRHRRLETSPQDVQQDEGSHGEDRSV